MQTAPLARIALVRRPAARRVTARPALVVDDVVALYRRADVYVALLATDAARWAR